MDDEDRENEGDFIIAAEKITPEKVNFMLQHGRGVLCVPLPETRCAELDLVHQVSNNTSMLGTPFTVTVDKLEGCTTGVSAEDRAATIRALADPNSKPQDFGRPGHINPLYAQERGVLKRAGHTEAAVDLARLAGLQPVAALIEIMNEDGTMARMPQLEKVAEEYGLSLISIKDLIAYRMQQGAAATEQEQQNAHVMVEKEGKGLIVYMNQEGRGIGLMNKIRAYKLQEQGEDTVEANVHLGFRPDERDYGVGAQILQLMGAKKLRLMTNNPIKRIGLESYGIEIVENIPIEVAPNPYNLRYMQTKKEKMCHNLNLV